MTNSKRNHQQNYEQQKRNFLDNLQPDDFRNGGSFNQAEIIIDNLNKALYQLVLKNNSQLNFDKNKEEEFIKKAALNLFRENSPAVEKLINLTKIYLEIKFEN